MKLRKNIKKNLQDKRKYKKSNITTNKKFKPLCMGINRSYGRDNSGKITVRHKSRGHKKVYRTIGVKRQRGFLDISAVVKTIEYDPNRSSFISLIKYKNGKHEYTHSLKNLKVGDSIISSRNKVENTIGNRTILKNMSVGAEICCIEEKPSRGWTLCLSAGTYASVVDILEKYATLKLSSGEIKKFNLNCMATIGRISNEQHKNFVMYKAGNSRNRGIRPTVRGTAMNSCAHPHGGGRGKTGTKRHPVSYTCKPTKGGKTANKKRPSRKNIIRYRKH